MRTGKHDSLLLVVYRETVSGINRRKTRAKQTRSADKVIPYQYVIHEIAIDVRIKSVIIVRHYIEERFRSTSGCSDV